MAGLIQLGDREGDDEWCCMACFTFVWPDSKIMRRVARFPSVSITENSC